MRDEFTTATIGLLAKRVGFLCSNPECECPTAGPGADPDAAVNLGVAAHITAASPEGPRFNPDLSPEVRRSPANGIWLCQNCAKLVDSDVTRYTQLLLRGWKEMAERKALERLQGAAPQKKRVAILRRTLEGHTNFVWDVAITPDGRRVLSASNDTTVRMWDIATGNHLATFGGHQAFVCSLAISNDGSLVATGAADGAIRVWNLGSAALICAGHHGALDAKVAWGPDTNRLVSGGADGHLRLWNLPDFAPHASILAHQRAILKVVFLDDGERIVSISADKTIRLCSAKTGECIRVCEGHTGEVNSVAVSADKRRMVSASEDKTLRVWDVEAGVCLAVLCGHDDIVWRVAVSPDCRLAASGGADNTVRIWDLHSNVCLQELPHPDCVAAVAFSPEGSGLAVGCDDSRVYMYTIDASSIG
jgi:WD40 repeat protein